MSANPVLVTDNTERRKRAIALWEQRVEILTTTSQPLPNAQPRPRSREGKKAG